MSVKGSIPRHGYDVYLKDQRVDTVRSGGFGPSVGGAIGTTYLPDHSVASGTEIEIDCRGKRVGAEVVKMPFYKGGSVKRG
jgi:aminomethyltransferase